MTTENKGVIYYKLEPDYHYKGDYTKNCGLNGGEIDGNFHFLRGYDISSFSTSETKEELVIKRLNGEEIKVNIKELFGSYDFAYDETNGVLKVTLPYGETFDLEGFLTEKSLRLYTDDTMVGEGTKNSPLSVSNVYRTGVYRPVHKIVDVLPIENIPQNARYITKENISIFGLLYPIEGVKAIAARLEEIGSKWRVPTKADWDFLLNSIEECDEDKNHNSYISNRFLGKNAGAFLKTNEKWADYYRKLENGEIVISDELYEKNDNGEYVVSDKGNYVKVITSENKYSFNVYPVGYSGRQGAESIEGFGKWAAYWTSTEGGDEDDMYVKVFSHKERGVEQTTWGKGCYLSLRLVCDADTYNLSRLQTIDGHTVDTNTYWDGDKGLTWTDVNICFTEPEYRGVASEEWENETETTYRYCINEWDGTRWLKNTIEEGESVVIFDVDGAEMHEWRLKNGVLVDTFSNVSADVTDSIVKLEDNLEIIAKKVAENTNSIAETNKNIGKKTDTTDTTVYGHIYNETQKLLGDSPVDGMKTIASLGRKIVKNEETIGNIYNDVATMKDNIDAVIESTENFLEESKAYTDSVCQTLKLTSNKNDVTIIENGENGTDVSVNIDNTTIVRNAENGVLSVNPEAFTKYVGDMPIVIEGEDIRTVSLKVSETDKVLDTTNGLSATLSLKWVKGDPQYGEQIQLLGKGGKYISGVDVAEFIKDGMLDTVTLNTDDEDNPKLVFTFNSSSGKDEIVIDVKELLTVYHAGNGLELNKDTSTFSVKIDETLNENDHLMVTANGVAFRGLNDVVEDVTAINNKLAIIEDLVGGGSGVGNSIVERLVNIENRLSEIETAIAKQDEMIAKLTSEEYYDELRKKIITSDNFKAEGDDIKVTVDNGTVTFAFGDNAVFKAEMNDEQ